MSELQGLLDREAQRVSAEPGALETVLHRVDRRRRNRRVATAVFALLLAAAAVSTLVKAFERSQPKPALPPDITNENVGDLRMAWTASPGGCCPMPSVSGDTVYVGWNDGLSAYPAYCATGGATCKPIWVGSVDDVSHHPKTTITDYGASRLFTPVVADGMVFSSDKNHLYAFPVDCGTGGATCKPSWYARTPMPKYGGSAAGVGDGFAFVGGGDGKLYAFRTHCGTGEFECPPSWTATGPGVPTVSDGVVYSNSRHRLYAYPVDCRTDGGTCQPLWRSPYMKDELAFNFSSPVVANGLVYIGGGSLYGFPTSCGTGGETCPPAWVGATGEPGGRVISWVVDDGMAFAVTTRGGVSYTNLSHVYAFPTDCGQPVCREVWSTKLAADAYLASGHGLLFVATFGGFISAYDERCPFSGGTCAPLWTIATFDAGAPYAQPIFTDRAVYVGGNTGRIYVYSVPSSRGQS